jgi:hypothetical protein
MLAAVAPGHLAPVPRYVHAFGRRATHVEGGPGAQGPMPDLIYIRRPREPHVRFDVVLRDARRRRATVDPTPHDATVPAVHRSADALELAGLRTRAERVQEATKARQGHAWHRLLWDW